LSAPYHTPLPHSFPTRRSSDLVVTAKARANIRHVLKHRRRAEAQSLGKRLLDKALVSLGSNLEQINDNQKARLLAETGADSFERSEEHTSELQSRENLVCRLLL